MIKKAVIRVRGQVQGVGFRPFVWQLAKRFGLSGEVLNDAEGVLIRARGAKMDDFHQALVQEAPPLSRIDAIEIADGDVPSWSDFRIVASGAAGAETRITPDAATCDACVQETLTPGSRRFGYAFTNCTHCGPRYTILNALPYDRGQTTMAPFEMCNQCRSEYEDPADRRFHAQPIACPDCGPRIWFEEMGAELAGDAIALAVERLRAGAVLGVKGLGGFHLACDAKCANALAELRTRKRRPSKPFAVMGRLDDLRAVAEIDADAEVLLRDPAAPIVLVPARKGALSDIIAPGIDHLGVMLPYTPLHHLLLDAFGDVLVMTSGNQSGEPQVVENDEAREKLSGFVDGFIMHNRGIARRLDDGVEVLGPKGAMVLRRARGRVPGTLPIPEGLSNAQVVAFGGQMKSAICLVKNGQAMLSHHLGELDDALTYQEFLKADADLSDLFDHRPDAVAVDRHPDFRASQYGRARADALGVPLIEVQHHHAHMAAQLGEAGWHGKSAVGLILDGLGLGPDGTVWGGEILVGGYRDVARAGCLRPAPLVGGDRAQVEPWRNALVRLDQAGLSDLADRLFPDAPRDMLRQVADRGVNAPLSSSVGRLFDAVAACLGLVPMAQSFEGEAAMRLQALALRAEDDGTYLMTTVGSEIDPVPMFQMMAEDLQNAVAPEVIARRFHRGVAQAFASAAKRSAQSVSSDVIALSGGCFQNTLLLNLVCAELTEYNLALPGQVPANDGGLAYGQALIALAHMESD